MLLEIFHAANVQSQQHFHRQELITRLQKHRKHFLVNAYNAIIDSPGVPMYLYNSGNPYLQTQTRVPTRPLRLEVRVITEDKQLAVFFSVEEWSVLVQTLE